MQSVLKNEALALRAWLTDAALPLWAERAIDDKGGFYEHLNLDGAADAEAIRRVRVQARQLYVYALAQQKGWYNSQNLLQTLFDFMCEYGMGRDGFAGFVHRINPDYSVHMNRRDLYDHVFYLFGTHWAASQGVKGANAVAEKIERFIMTLDHPDGGWAEGVPEINPRRQNPHMHMFEASMAIYELTGDARWIDSAGRVFELFKRYFFDETHHIVREFFNDDWSIHEGELGDTTEPGHAAEWVWLLGRYETLSGESTRQWANALYERYQDRQTIFLNDEEDVKGVPRRTTKRLWCQTELVKSHIAQARMGHNQAVEALVETLPRLREVYLNDDGTWVDQIDEAGKPVAQTIPVSTFYHIICMISELDDLANSLK